MRRGVLLGLAVSAAMLLAYLLLWSGLSHVDQVGSDYSASHVAAQSWRAGQGDRLYDAAYQRQRHEALVPSGYHVDLPFITPPTTAVLTAPFTVLDLATAWRLFSALELVLVLAAAALAARAAPAPGIAGGRLVAAAAGAAGAGSAILLFQGQWDGVCALGLAAAYAAWRRGNPGLAGAALGLAFGATKPHLALGLAAFLAGRRDRRAAAGALAGLVPVIALGLLPGVHAWPDWVASLRVSSGHSPLHTLLGYTGLFGTWLGDVPAVEVLAGAASLLALAAAAVLGARSRGEGMVEPALAGATALSLVAAPHLLLHDLAVLAPAAAWTLCWAMSRRSAAPAATLWIVLNLAALLDGLMPDPPGRLVPWALTATGAVALLATSPRRARLRTAAVAG